MSAIRQNFHESCEAAINKQINMELYASYVYMSMVRNLPFYAVLFNFLTELNTLYMFLQYMITYVCIQVHVAWPLS